MQKGRERRVAAALLSQAAGQAGIPAQELGLGPAQGRAVRALSAVNGGNAHSGIRAASQAAAG